MKRNISERPHSRQLTRTHETSPGRSAGDSYRGHEGQRCWSARQLRLRKSLWPHTLLGNIWEGHLERKNVCFSGLFPKWVTARDVWRDGVSDVYSSHLSVLAARRCGSHLVWQTAGPRRDSAGGLHRTHSEWWAMKRQGMYPVFKELLKSDGLVQIPALCPSSALWCWAGYSNSLVLTHKMKAIRMGRLNEIIHVNYLA